MRGEMNFRSGLYELLVHTDILAQSADDVNIMALSDGTAYEHREARDRSMG